MRATKFGINALGVLLDAGTRAAEITGIEHRKSAVAQRHCDEVAAQLLAAALKVQLAIVKNRSTAA